MTLSHSKKLTHHRAGVSLYVAHYNFCRVHETLRITPAMQLGVTGHIWTIGELVDAALSAPEPEPVPRPTLPKGMSAAEAKAGQTAVQPKRLFVIKGGKK